MHEALPVEQLMALFFLGLIIGLALGGRLRLLASLREKLFRPKPAAAPAPVEASPAPAEPAEEPLAIKLRKAEAPFLAAADNAAHPREFLDQPSFKEMTALLRSEDVSQKTLLQYALGANWALSCAGLAALAERADRDAASEQVLSAFDRLPPWAMWFALGYFQSLKPRPPLGAPFVTAKEWWKDNAIVQTNGQEYLDEAEQLGDLAAFGPALDAAPPANYPLIRAFLEKLHGPLAGQLIAEIDAKQRAVIDRTFLTSFGRFWGAGEPKLDLLVEPEAWREILIGAEAAVLSNPPRSLLASGDPRIGKTSFFRLLAKRIERDGWQVFEASGADLMAGQQWFGQLEGRIQKALEELVTSKKLIWYIPDILQIAMSGTHQGQAASILEQIIPAISSGRLIVWTEASPAGAARLLRQRPQLRNMFEATRFEPLSPEATLALAGTVTNKLLAETGIDIGAACAETALSSARQYLNSTALPGSALDLLKSAILRAIKGHNRSVAPSDVIAALSQATGVPAAILDSKERAELAAIRKYFAARVMGQDEAVSTVVDRIAMLKAGLNDPGKPIGVFLFAGPTGTGKTELAKTLAEFLFGSPDRMIRLDMSEYQTQESTWKILGAADPSTQADSLIGRVRKQPFSVVLLDEFEKAHSTVWDLFLQVFDDARLTDAAGQEADFRHCIIILTTNLGATTHRSADLGFLPGTSTFSSDQVLRAVSQTFRPEFQNRLDRVIVFQPLDRELMRGILKKELSRVLERRGFKDREWAVEWEASALEFLLEKGFSPEMGARPLKRAIDQYVIAPLAATIVERRFPEGDQFVFVRSDGKAIQAEFVDPDGEVGPLPPTVADADNRPSLAVMILNAAGAPAELQALEHHHDEITAAFASEAWAAEKTALSAKIQGEGFWTRPERYEVLSRLALMDRVRAAAETAESLRARLAKGAGREGRTSRELVARLALQLHLLGEGVKDVLEAAPLEAALAIEGALDGGAGRGDADEWREKLLGMYRAWGSARNMQVSEARRAKEETILLIGGFGAYRTLAHEAGLHVLEMPEEDRSLDRVTARVRVAAAPFGELPQARLHAALAGALSQSPLSNAVVRRYRNGASPLVRDMAAGWRTGRLDAVLRGDFDLITAAQTASAANSETTRKA
jgi:ATP-dependent Clp protease ATP-binding subunit ClpC